MNSPTQLHKSQQTPAQNAQWLGRLVSVPTPQARCPFTRGGRTLHPGGHVAPKVLGGGAQERTWVHPPLA
eukprot:7377948-Prymnesium_polylepis.1